MARGGKKNSKNDFTANSPKQESKFDSVTETKMSKKEANRARFAGPGLGLGAAGRLGLAGGAGTSALADLDVFGLEDSDSSDSHHEPGKGYRDRGYNSSDSSNDRAPLPGRRRGGTATAPIGLGGLGGNLGALGTASFAVDWRTTQPPAAGRYVLPAGVEMVGADPTLEEQEDGSCALVVPEGAHLKCALRCSPWILQEDGRLHTWTICCAMRIDRLPSSALAIASGRPAPSNAEKTENVQVYKNGGVGALGHMGTQEAALRAERWAWVVITRKAHEMNTYVNGQLCSRVPIPPQRPPKKPVDVDKKEGRSQQRTGAADAEDGEDDDSAFGGRRGGKAPKNSVSAEAERREALMLERFCLEPAEFGLFFATAAQQDDERRAEEPERGLSIKYLRVLSEVWSAEDVRTELHKLRSADEAAELLEDAEASRAQHMSLQALYAKPPPIWLHPAFAAEFGDAFIGGTALENGALHISLEVVALTVSKMLEPVGGAASGLAHETRAALNSASQLFLDAKKLAHKFMRAKGDGQDRLFLLAVASDIQALEPGGTLLVPCEVGGIPLIFIVRRNSPPAEETCTFVAVSCKAAGLSHHEVRKRRAHPQPPSSNPNVARIRICL